MTRRLIQWGSALILLILIVPGGVARAGASVQDTGPVLDVRVGFDGYVQTGTWAPINVTASNDGDNIEGELRVVVQSLGAGRTLYTRPIDLPRGSRKQVTLYIADVSTFGQEISVELVRRGRVLKTEPEQVQFIPPTTLLIGVLSDSPQGLADLALVKPSSGETKVALLTAEDLPAIGEGWRALDVLVIADSDTGKLNAEQQAAMAEWVTSGGRLVLIGGPAYQRTLAGVGVLSPITVSSTPTVSVEPLTAAAGEPLDPQIDASALVATGDVAADAQVLVQSENVPLLIAQPVGQGQVDFLAADPNLEPLRSWDALGDLWLMILSNGQSRPGWAYGFGDRWEFARSAASAVPGIRLPSVLALCGFLGLYVVLIGPVNYFVLWRLKRRELAWVTIPVLVLAFSAIAYVTGFQLRGSQAVVHRLGVLRMWPDAQTAKLDVLVGVWSPRRSSYNIELEPGFLVRPIPAAFGGGLTSVSETTIQEGEAMQMRNVQVDVGSVQTFVIEGYTEVAPRIEAELEAEIVTGGLRVRGEITNFSDLDLSEVTLMVGGQTYRLPDLAAGEVTEVDALISSTQSTPSGGATFDPFPANSGYNAYYYGGFTSLVNEITHDSNCYEYGNTDNQRTCNLVNSILSAEWRGSGLYLFGWTDQVPLDLQVLNARSRSEDKTLIIAELEVPSIDVGQGAVEIPPSLMTWQLLSFDPNQGYVNSPYDFYVSSTSSIVFRFEPVALLSRPNVSGLIIHLEEPYGYGATGLPRVWLRNFETGVWDSIDVGWGETRVADALPYIDARGGVELRIRGANGLETNVSRFDITLLGE